MKTFTLLLLLIVLLAAIEPCYGQWTRHIIDSSVNYTCFIDVYDMGNDGDMDVFLAEYGENRIVWYENINMTWKEHTIVDNFAGVVGLKLYDLNEDGYVDVFSAAGRDATVVWYENDGSNPINWIPHIIDSTFYTAETVRLSDFNGDGLMDVVAQGWAGKCVWYENNYPEAWIPHQLSDNKTGASPGCYVADLNNDTRPDIISNHIHLSLYINNLPDTNWTTVLIDTSVIATFTNHCADIDMDGDLDIVANASLATDEIADIAWYENDGSGLNWTKHSVTTEMQSARWVYLEDMDKNGFTDIVCTDIEADEIIVFFNNDAGQSWTKNVVDNTIILPNPVFAFDIDLDNEYDIIPASIENKIFAWYKYHKGAAFPQSMDINQFSLVSSDTLEIKASVQNPEKHAINVFAIIEGDQFKYVDTIELFNDGLHNDEIANDNIWANILIAADLLEDWYNVTIYTYDSVVDAQIELLAKEQFITFGPLAYASFIFSDHNITSLYTGDKKIKIQINLKNDSKVASATNISAVLSSLNEHVSIHPYRNNFEDIEAQGISLSTAPYPVTVSENCPTDIEIPIAIDIYCNDILCWYDTFSTTILVKTPVLDELTQQKSIYPNPTHEIINLTLNTGENTIKIFDLNGKLIFRKQITTYEHLELNEVNISHLKKGVYLLNISNKNTNINYKFIVN